MLYYIPDHQYFSSSHSSDINVVVVAAIVQAYRLYSSGMCVCVISAFPGGLSSCSCRNMGPCVHVCAGQFCLFKLGPLPVKADGHSLCLSVCMHVCVLKRYNGGLG